MGLSAISKIVPFLRIGAKAAPAAAQTTQKMAMGEAFRKALFADMGAGQIAGRLAPDAIFGGMAAMQTPGDLGDKLIAGGTQFIGGGLGGLATAGVARKLNMGAGAETVADFMGSYGGDFAGMAVGDTLQRGKDRVMGGEGQTAWERMSADQQKEFANQIRNETLSSMGVGPGYLPGMQDQYLSNLGLG